MFPCAPSAEGVIPVLDNAALGIDDSYRSGWINRSTGALHISTTAAPAMYLAGFACDTDGRMCFSISGLIARYIMGIPITEDGRIVVNPGVPVIGDAYVAGVRVSPTGVFIS